MDWKKIGKAILFPHIAIMMILFPIATVFLIYSLLFMESDSIIAIVSYVLALYTLLVWILKTPHLIKFCKNFKDKNKYARIWQDDDRLRVNISLYGTLIRNTAYAPLQHGMGFWHHTFWFYSIAVMRFFLARYTTKYKPSEKMREELIRYRLCG